MELKSQRKCEECTACCEGWLSANIYGHIMSPGKKCHFLGKNCTIYNNRPEEICKRFQCAWLEDPNYFIPEWIKPSESKIIIVRRSWGENSDNVYWSVVECGEKMKAEVLHWLLIHCDTHSIPLEYEFNGGKHYKGPKEFHEFIKNKSSI